MLGKILVGLRYFLINAYKCTTASECSICHTVIQPGDYLTKIDGLPYCIKCRQVKAVTSPSNFRTDLVKNERLQQQHRKIAEATREKLREKEKAEFLARCSSNHPQVPTPLITRDTEPINLATGDDRENVCIFKIDRFTRTQIMSLDTAILPTVEQQKQA